MLKRLICKFKGHTLVEAGRCPFTEKSYLACTKCDKMVSVQETHPFPPKV